MNIYDKAFLVRVLATLIFFLAIRKFSNIQYFYVPIFLSILDGIDSDISSHSSDPNPMNTFSYKIRDKIADALSYFFVYALFPIEKEFLYYLMLRVVGIVLFGQTRDVRWLIAFPDMMKEWLFFHFIYRGEMSAFPILIPVKMCFELWHHTIDDPMPHVDRIAVRAIRNKGLEFMGF